MVAEIYRQMNGLISSHEQFITSRTQKPRILKQSRIAS